MKPKGRPRLDPQRPKAVGVNVYLRPDQAGKLTRLAKKLGKTRSQVVRDYLDHTVEGVLQDYTAASLRREPGIKVYV